MQPYGQYPQKRYATPAAEFPAPPPKKPRQPLLLLMLAVCVVVFITCAVLLIRYFSSIAASRSAASKLEEIYSAAVETAETPQPSATPQPTAKPAAQARPTPDALPEKEPSATPTPVPVSTEAPQELWPTTYPNNPNLRVSSVFQNLQKQNPDIIGWLKIEGVLEEAVAQEDNEFYLTHNILRQPNVTGALFLDEMCDLRTVPTQLLIHGHNMKEGAMFGSLMKYKVKDASFYHAHPFVDFNTVYEDARYVIFAVAEVDIRYSRPDYLPFWHNMRFDSAEAFMDYVNRARSMSQIRCNVDVVPGDRLLTMSTCTVSDENKRLIVMARKLRPGEDELALKMSIFSSSDR